MKPLVKVSVVLVGYVVAFAITAAVIAVYVAATNGSARQSSGGMSAFGDSLLFLAVFVAAAVPATGAALFFLRPFSSFWLILSVVAPCVAITGLAALIDYIAAQTSNAHSVFQSWSGLAVLRILAAPLFALAFLLAGLFAPSRSSRIVLLVATASEAVVFAGITFMWFYFYVSH